MTKTTERVSLGTGGTQADGESAQGAISTDGRIVAFASNAPNLNADPTSGFATFVRDRSSGSTELVGAGWTPALSADGRYVAFAARGGTILVRDRALGMTENVSVATDGSQLSGIGAVPTISADGRFVAFLQHAIGDNRAFLYVRDRSRQTTERVDVESPDNPAISSDGRSIVFSAAGGVFVSDLAAETTELASVSGNGSSYTGSGPVSADGGFVAFYSLASNLAPSDANGMFDVFVRDRHARTTELVSVARVTCGRAASTTSRLRPSCSRARSTGPRHAAARVHARRASMLLRAA